MPTIPCCTTAKSPGSVVNCKSLPLSSSSTSTTSSTPSWCNYEKMDKRAFLIMSLKHLNPVSLRIVKAWSGSQGGQDHPLLIKHVAHSILLTAPTLPQDWVQLTLQQPVPVFFKMCSTFSTQITSKGVLPEWWLYSWRELQPAQRLCQDLGLPTRTRCQVHLSRPWHL